MNSKMATGVKGGVVRARIPDHLKVESEDILNDLGLSMSDAIRLFLTQIVNRKAFPLELLSPNEVTVNSINSQPIQTKYKAEKGLFGKIIDDANGNSDD